LRIFGGKNKVSKSDVKNYNQYRTLDSDGDGLLDWEEALFGTDPKLVDTNGDGISDYDEFEETRGNIASNSNQSLTGGATGVSASDQSEATPSNNLTDALGRDLYASMSIASQNSGGTLTEADNDRLSAIASRAIVQYDFRVHTIDELKIAPDNSTKATLQDSIIRVWSKYPLMAEDLQRVLIAIDREETVPIDILARANKYREIIPKLLLLSIPKGVTNQYLAYINASEAYVNALVVMIENDTDPARAISAITNIESILEVLEKSEKDFWRQLAKV